MPITISKLASLPIKPHRFDGAPHGSAPMEEESALGPCSSGVESPLLVKACHLADDDLRSVRFVNRNAVDPIPFRPVDRSQAQSTSRIFTLREDVGIPFSRSEMQSS
jgi:hypothetical protein